MCVLLLCLLLLDYGILFFSSFALEGATERLESGWGAARPSWSVCSQGSRGHLQSLWSAFVVWQEKGVGEREIMIVTYFPEKKKTPPIQFVCKGNEGCFADVGCCHRLTAPPAPAAVQGRGVSCIYIYIYIYLYIYAFPSQSHQ